MYNFIWDGKPDKIKRDTLIKDINKGGLKMIDIEKFIWSLKASWVKRLLQNDGKSLLKDIYDHELKPFGGCLLFESNFNENDIRKYFEAKPFLRDILLSWRKINTNPVISNYCNEILWNNSEVRIGENTVFFKNWFQSGVKHLKDIFDQDSNTFYSFRKLKDKYDLTNAEFLKYIGLLNSIPKEWKTKIKHENINIQPDLKLVNHVKTTKQVNKYIYNCLIDKTHTYEVKPEKKWNECFEEETLTWKLIYTAPFKSTNDVQLRNFQYKYLMRVIPTNLFLTKCRITDSSLCSFCNMEIETINHLFWECLHVQHFWRELANYVNQCEPNFDVCFKTISFGICKTKLNLNQQVKNVVIYLAKYFIFCCKQNKQLPYLRNFKSYLAKRIKIEKEIALMNDKLPVFEHKWRNLDEILSA